MNTSPALVTPNIGAASATSLSATGNVSGDQLTSTIADGTAPLIVTSTTPVANLSIGGNAATATNATTVTTNANLTGPITSVGNATSVASQTGTGSTFVMNTSPTLVTPDLGTPTALVGTNITGTAAGLTAGNVTTNANLTGEVTSVGNAATVTNAAVIGKVLTGYTSGAGVVAATDNILEAIQKLDGNNATNANLTGPITSVGNATSVAAQTGTGSTFVMNTSPTLVTPNIGAATATSINKVTITAPATSSTLTIAEGKTLTSSNTLTLAGTDGSTLNIGAGGTLGSNAYTSTAYAPIASPTFPGTVAIPSPFTLGATSVTTTGTQLNYLNAATGTTGTGLAVFATSPSLVTPDLGTPSSATLTNATGLPVSTGISGLGAGVATMLATPSSANIAAAITDETGSGSAVFATSPTLTTPNIGAASGTSLSATGSITSSGTAGIGYSSGAGGSEIQITSKSTAVTIDKISGQITTHNETLISNGYAVFQVNNSTVSATDIPLIVLAGGPAIYYELVVTEVNSGNFKILIINRNASSRSEAVVINFAIIKAAND